MNYFFVLLSVLIFDEAFARSVDKNKDKDGNVKLLRLRNDQLLDLSQK